MQFLRGFLNEKKEEFVVSFFFTSFTLVCFQYYQYYLMLRFFVRSLLLGVYTIDLFQHGNKKF